MKSLVYSFISLAGFPSIATADTLVLNDGTVVHGTLTDRRAVVRSLQTPSIVSIRTLDRRRVFRFEAADIDHVVVEWGHSNTLVDFAERRRLFAPVEFDYLGVRAAF